MKDPQWYAVEASDTTMMTKAASWFGQKKEWFYRNERHNDVDEGFFFTTIIEINAIAV